MRPISSHFGSPIKNRHKALQSNRRRYKHAIDHFDRALSLTPTRGLGLGLALTQTLALTVRNPGPNTGCV